VLFQGFRRYLEAISALTSALEESNEIHRGLGPDIKRLENLERSRLQFEAECEGMLLKADGKLKAAASSEQRERQIRKANLRLADPFGETGEEGAEPASVFTHDVARGETERLQALPMAVAPNNKTRAVRAKFGL